MVVLNKLRGLDVSVCVDGSPLQEYDYDDEEVAEPGLWKVEGREDGAKIHRSQVRQGLLYSIQVQHFFYGLSLPFQSGSTSTVRK